MEKYNELQQEDYQNKAYFQEHYSHVISMIDLLEEKEKKILTDQMKIEEQQVYVKNLTETLETRYLDIEKLEDLKEKHKILGVKHKGETMMATSALKLHENLTVQLSELKREFEESNEGKELLTLRAEFSQTDTNISALMQQYSEMENTIEKLHNDDQKYRQEIDELEQEICEKEKMSNSLNQEINSTDDTLMTLQKKCGEKLSKMITTEKKQSDIQGTSSQSEDNFCSLLNFSIPIKISNEPEIKEKDNLFSGLFIEPQLKLARVGKSERKSYPAAEKPDKATKEISWNAVSEPKKPLNNQKNASTRETVQQESPQEMQTDGMEINLDQMYSSLKSPVHVSLSQYQNLGMVEKNKARPRKRFNFDGFPESFEFKMGETKKMKCSQKLSQEARTSSQEKKVVPQVEAKNTAKEKMNSENQEVQEKLKPPGKPKLETKAQVKMKFLEREESKKFPETKRIQVLENIVVKPALKPSAKPPPSPSESSVRESSELNFDMDMGDIGDYGTDVGSGDYNIESDNGEFNFQIPSDNAAQDNFGW